MGEEEEEAEEGVGGVHCQDTERLPHTFSTEQVRIMGSPSSNEELLDRDTVMLLSGEGDRQETNMELKPEAWVRLGRWIREV